MTQQQAEAFFVLSGFTVQSMTKLANGYWPESPAYAEIREQNPWWLVETQFGRVMIGWRKRVISIDWKTSGFTVVEPLTQDNVTQGPCWVHAWSPADAVRYLTELAQRMQQKKARAQAGREAVYKKRKVPTETELAEAECASRGFVFEKLSRRYTINNQKGTEAECATLDEVWETLEFDPEFAATKELPATTPQ